MRLRWIERLNHGLAIIAGLLIALIMVLTCIDVASRTIFNRSLQGASELIILFLVALVFLGFAGAEAKGANFSVTILVRTLSRRTQVLLKILTTIVSLVAIGTLTWFSWTRAIASMASGEQSYGVISFPVWPSRLVIAVGLTMLVVQLLIELVHPRPAPGEVGHD